MTIFDLNVHPDEYQPFECNVEQKHIDEWRSNLGPSPIQLALNEFLKKHDVFSLAWHSVDRTSEGSSCEQRKYRTNIESRAFQVPEYYVYEDVDIEKGVNIVTVPRFQKVELKHNERLDAWINHINRISEGIPNYELPGPIVIQLKVKMSSPYGELSIVRYAT